jgi:hypothetical protein
MYRVCKYIVFPHVFCSGPQVIVCYSSIINFLQLFLKRNVSLLAVNLGSSKLVMEFCSQLNVVNVGYSMCLLLLFFFIFFYFLFFYFISDF